MGTVLKVTENGRLNLPAQMRKTVGLERGGPVSIWVEDGEIRIRSVRSVMANLQREARALLADAGETVDDLIRERRAEAEAEERRTA